MTREQLMRLLGAKDQTETERFEEWLDIPIPNQISPDYLRNGSISILKLTDLSQKLCV